MCKRILVVSCLLFLAASSSHAEDLTIWHTETDPLTIQALDTIARGFESENPDIHVKVVSVGWQDLYQKITIAIQSGEVPVLTQIEPFMAAYLYYAGQLQPLDDVIDGIGKADIFPAVLDLQLFNGKRYGIATALGISYYSYRKDFLPAGTPIENQMTWNDYLRFVQQEQTNGRKAAPLLLPANDLHMTLLFTELLASNGGSLFNSSNQPDFTNPKVIETLRFWQQLFDLVPTNLQNSPYQENFTHYAQGRALSLPCFFGRGALQIERSAPEGERSPDNFALLPHPIGTTGTTASATLDAEPWVILKNSPNPDLAKKFLRFFYRKDNYQIFCSSVPIHLTPILQSLARGTEYTDLSLVRKWKPYYDYQISMLDKGAVLPIFMARLEDRLLPALFKLEGSQIVSTMVRDVTLRHVTPEQATKDAMARTAELLEGLPSTASQQSPTTSSMRVVVIVIGGLIFLTSVVFFLWRRRLALKS